MKKVVALAFAVLCLLGVFIFTHPSVIPELPALRESQVEMKGNSVVLHFETLGDYPTEVRTFSIAAADNPTHPIFALQADPSELITHSFILHTGKNSADFLDPEEHSYKVEVSNAGDAFFLVPGKTYLAKLCTRNLLRSSVTFTMPSAT